MIAALNERVPPPKAGGSLVVQKTGRRRYTLLRSVWFWMVLAVVLTGAVWLGGYLWLQDLLNQQLPEHL